MERELPPALSTRTACGKRQCCAAEGDAAPDMCAICQESLGDPLEQVTLECGHVFHGKCMVEALIRNTNCPLCRFDLAHGEGERNHYEIFGDDDDSTNTDEFITVKEALSVATDVALTDRATARSLKTLDGWKQTVKSARRRLKNINMKLDPHEKAIDDEVSQFVAKVEDRFATRFAKLLKEQTDARRAVKNARKSFKDTRVRIAKKHGYVPWSRSRQ